jgi:hypothetical protein
MLSGEGLADTCFQDRAADTARFSATGQLLQFGLGLSQGNGNAPLLSSQQLFTLYDDERPLQVSDLCVEPSGSHILEHAREELHPPSACGVRQSFLRRGVGKWERNERAVAGIGKLQFELLTPEPTVTHHGALLRSWSPLLGSVQLFMQQGEAGHAGRHQSLVRAIPRIGSMQ